MRAIVKSTKWYARFWPPERRKVKIMQAIYDYNAAKIEAEVNKEFRDYYIYGKIPVDKPLDNNK